jgi:hypothetical protein
LPKGNRNNEHDSKGQQVNIFLHSVRYSLNNIVAYTFNNTGWAV